MNPCNTDSRTGDASTIHGPYGRVSTSVEGLEDFSDRPLQFSMHVLHAREHFGTDHAFLPRDELLTYEEIAFVVEALMGCGLQKVRLTGGEPLLRRNITELVALLRQVGPGLDIAMTTNGALLKSHAAALFKAGVDRVTVSIDAVETSTFQAMADTDQVDPQAIFDGVDEALRVGLTVKANAVIRRGVNEDQILPLAHICHDRGVPLRFIEYMDVGNTNAWKLDEVVSGADIRRMLETEFGPLEPISPKNAARSQGATHARRGMNVGSLNPLPIRFGVIVPVQGYRPTAPSTPVCFPLAEAMSKGCSA